MVISWAVYSIYHGLFIAYIMGCIWWLLGGMAVYSISWWLLGGKYGLYIAYHGLQVIPAYISNNLLFCSCVMSSIVGVLYNNVYIHINAGAVQVKTRWARIYIVLMAGRAADCHFGGSWEGGKYGLYIAYRGGSWEENMGCI